MVESYVRGFHVYIWTPTTGERLPCQAEDSNDTDPYAVAIKKRTNIIRHVPRKISAACSRFIERGGTITCTVTDSHRQYSSDLPQGGLQIPCKLEFHSDNADLMSKIRKLIRSAPPIDFKVKKPVPKRKLQLPSKTKNEPPLKKKERHFND